MKAAGGVSAACVVAALVAVCVIMLPVRAFVDSTRFPASPGSHTYSALGSGEGAMRGDMVRRLEAMPGRPPGFRAIPSRGLHHNGMGI